MHERVTEGPLAVYRRHLDRGELAYQVSPGTGAAVFPPRLICPATGTTNLEWRISAGTGTVHAVTVVHTGKEARHAVVLVDLDEGFRMLSAVEGLAPEAIRIGQRVKVRIRPPENPDEAPCPVFDPLAAA